MISEYDEQSCNALQKPFYRPVEAALRWCGLIDKEKEILQEMNSEVIPTVTMFPQWPCLRANTEKIVDAIHNNELALGRDGQTVSENESVAKQRRTIRHTDLKKWMIKNYPDQKPAFLFDEIERNTHSSINKNAYITLQADRDALKTRVENATVCYQKLQAQNKTLFDENVSLQKKLVQRTGISEKEETTFLNIIGGLIQLLQMEPPSETYPSQDSIINALVDKFPNVQGIKIRTLQEKFANANKNLNTA